MTTKNPQIIEGDIFSDNRGILSFINDFDLGAIKRMYYTTNANIDIIRAWQAHKIESRWFLCTNGTFKVKLVKVEDWDLPKASTEIYEFDLNSEKPEVLLIPPGFANGFKAESENARLMIFSDYYLNEIVDNYKFDFKNFKEWE